MEAFTVYTRQFELLKTLIKYKVLLKAEEENFKSLPNGLTPKKLLFIKMAWSGGMGTQFTTINKSFTGSEH